jgi:hypothetical protein
MSVLEGILLLAVTHVGAFVAGVFVYRNNKKEFGKYADKVDDLYDKVEDLIENRTVLPQSRPNKHKK